MSDRLSILVVSAAIYAVALTMVMGRYLIDGWVR
jgi:hypothetical protein